MGWFKGDTFIIENGGPYVEYSRTYSHIKYQPEKVGIAFNCPPDVPLSDGLYLAEQLVNARLGLPVNDKERVDELAKRCLNEPLSAFVRHGKKSLKVAHAKRVKQTASPYVDMDDDYDDE